MKTVASIPTCIKKKYEPISKIYKIEDLRKIMVRQQRVVKLKPEELSRETVEKDKTMRNGDCLLRAQKHIKRRQKCEKGNKMKQK